MPAYIPAPPPQDLNFLNRYIHEELWRLSAYLSAATEVVSGGMYLVTPPSVVGVVHTTPVILTEYDAEASGMSGVVADTGSGTLTVQQDAVVTMSMYATMSASSNNKNVTVQLYKNGEAFPGAVGSVFLETANSPLSVSITGRLPVARGDVFDIRVTSASSTTITLQSLLFQVYS